MGIKVWGGGGGGGTCPQCPGASSASAMCMRVEKRYKGLNLSMGNTLTCITMPVAVASPLGKMIWPREICNLAILVKLSCFLPRTIVINLL